MRPRPGADESQVAKALSPWENQVALLIKKFSKNRMFSSSPRNREWKGMEEMETRMSGTSPAVL